MAGLRHQHGGRQVAAPPVAADIGVGLVPEPDRLEVLDAHDVTELPGGHDLLDRAGVRRVAQHVADGEHDPGLLHGRHDPPAPRLVRCHRLLQQDVIAQRGERLGWLRVHPVLRADQDRVGEPAAAGQLPPAGGRVSRRDAVLGGEAGAAGLIGFGYRDDGRAVGVTPGPAGIPGAALARPDDDQRNRCHTSDLPCRRTCPAAGVAGPEGPRRTSARARGRGRWFPRKRSGREGLRSAGGQAHRIYVLIVGTGRTRELGH